MKLERKITKEICDSYHSTKCIGVGNGRKQSTTTKRLRRHTNKMRRRLLKEFMKRDNVQF